MTYIPDLPMYPFTIIAALIGVLGILYIFRLKAGRHFRQIVLSELKGIYPEPRITVEQSNTQIRQSIKEIESASAEYRRFVSFYRKSSFDVAVQEYCKTARETNWQNTLDFSKSMPYLKDKNPKEIFKQHVDELLKYAK
jgi:hypothetical protein